MAFRNASTAYTSGSNSLTGTAPSGTTAGDVLIAIFSQDGSGATLTFPTGWTKVRTDNITNGDQQTVAWGWKIATGSDSYAFTGSTGNDIGVCIAAYTGRDGTTPVEISTVNNPNSASPPTSPVSVTATGLTTSNIDDIVYLGACDTNGGNGLWTSPAAMTLRTETTNSGSFCALMIGDFSQSSAGVVANQTGTWTNGTNQGNPLAYLVALQPSGGGGGSNVLQPWQQLGGMGIQMAA